MEGFLKRRVDVFQNRRLTRRFQPINANVTEQCTHADVEKADKDANMTDPTPPIEIPDDRPEPSPDIDPSPAYEPEIAPGDAPQEMPQYGSSEAPGTEPGNPARA
ncbi:hypothetical protein [Brevundimonas variabilis]|uniref:Uncharacterized protein n=1 Tax=Brevundimonas variabilis TaxID=74312 RepID=A0A7W9CIA1_9CAUL|nr:hypothetical protein [Brevundimonas variabilis]MBB5746041.1 hypothetical protein [Brevundimonas variabilis]